MPNVLMVKMKAARLNKARERALLNRRELAIKAGISAATLQKAASGKRISASIARRISESLGLNIEDVCIRTD